MQLLRRSQRMTPQSVCAKSNVSVQVCVTLSPFNALPRLAGTLPYSTDPDSLRPTGRTAVHGLACPNVTKIDALSDTTLEVSSRAAATF